MANTITPAQIILQQLGGSNKLRVAIGARDFFSDDEGASLVFKIGSGAQQGIQHIKVHHNAIDTYDVTFSKITHSKDKTLSIRIPEAVVIAEHQNVYGDTLKPLIEQETGFYLNPFG